MNISIANVLPSPPPQPPPPPSSDDSTDSSQPSGFSQQLTRAKSKAPQAADARATQQPAAPAATTDPKKAQPGSTQDKNKKGQQNQPETTDASGDADAEKQVPASNESNQDQADLAAAAQNPQVLIRSKVLLPASVQVTQLVTATSNTKGTPKTGTGKPGQSATNSSDNATTQNATTQSLAGAQQTAATDKNATSDASANADDSEADADVLKQASTHPNVSPFKAQDAQEAAQAEAEAAATTEGQLPAKTAVSADGSASTAFADLLPAAAATTAPVAGQIHPALAAATPVAQTPVAQFAETNQPAIVSTIHGSLMPNGGTMNITLNPPDLGAMQISVRMENGVMSASFQTSSEQATRLLTHTLGQLKDALETQGVTVDRLHVQQTSKSEEPGQGNDSESNGKQGSSNGQSAQQEQQRKETLRRMWRRARGERDPLDLVA